MRARFCVRWPGRLDIGRLDRRQSVAGLAELGLDDRENERVELINDRQGRIEADRADLDDFHMVAWARRIPTRRFQVHHDQVHDVDERAYEWLIDMGDEGSWNNYYLPDGTIEDVKLDTNVCACTVYPSLERFPTGKRSAYTGPRSSSPPTQSPVPRVAASCSCRPPSPADPTPFEHVVPRH